MTSCTVDVERDRSAVLYELLVEASGFVERDRHAARACLGYALSLLAREAPASAPVSTESGVGKLAPWQVKRVAAFVEAHIEQTIRVEDLAATAKLTCGYFGRAFKASFGLTPHAYVVQRRIEHACRMMLESDEPLSQIARACGLCDQAHFSRIFRKSCGVPPGVWRRERRGSTALAA